MKDPFSARRYGNRLGTSAGTLAHAGSGAATGFARSTLFREQRRGNYKVGLALLEAHKKITSAKGYSPYVQAVARDIVARIAQKKVRPSSTNELQVWANAQRLPIPKGIDVPTATLRVGKVGSPTISAAINLLAHEGILVPTKGKIKEEPKRELIPKQVNAASGRRIVSARHTSMVAKKRTLVRSMTDIEHVFTTPDERMIVRSLAQEILKGQVSGKAPAALEDMFSAVSRQFRGQSVQFGARKRIVNPTMLKEFYTIMKEKGFVEES